MKAVVAAFNQEKALVGAFSMIVQPVVEPMDCFTALPVTSWRWSGGRWSALAGDNNTDLQYFTIYCLAPLPHLLMQSNPPRHTAYSPTV